MTPFALFVSTNASDLGPTFRAFALHSRAPILESDLLGVFHFHHFAIFNTISLDHFYTSEHFKVDSPWMRYP